MGWGLCFSSLSLWDPGCQNSQHLIHYWSPCRGEERPLADLMLQVKCLAWKLHASLLLTTRWLQQSHDPIQAEGHDGQPCICPEGAELEIFHEQHYELLRELWFISGLGSSRSSALPAVPGVACPSRGEGRGLAQQLSLTP